MTTWVDALEPGAPDIVATWSAVEEGSEIAVQREVRRRAGEGSVSCIVPRCGEWRVVAGVHDLMRLDQLHAIMRA